MRVRAKMRKKKSPERESDSMESRGASRREFLAGAGLTGVAMAAGAWPALAPAVASAAAGSAGLPVAADKRGYSAGKFAVELDGISAGFVASTEGGGAYSDVVNEKVGADHIVRKHIAGVKYEDISVTVGAGMSKGFYDWIKSTFAMSPERKNGAIVVADFSYKELTRVTFINALITEIGMPALDAGSKDPAKMTIKFAPEATRRSDKGGGSVPSGAGAKQKMWTPANFRLTIPGLDCTKVNKIEALTIKQAIIGNAVGELRSQQKEPAAIDFPNLVVTLPDGFAKDWYDWHEDFVIKGNNTKEKSGFLEYLTPDLKTVIFKLDFDGIGIFKLSPEKVEAGAESIRRVKAEMYVETIKFGYPGASA